MNEQNVLNFDPFAGDFGEQGDRVIVNKMVNVRKEHECSNCKATIQKGERSRMQCGVYGNFITHRWCNLCCVAMDKFEQSEGDDDSYEQRARP